MAAGSSGNQQGGQGGFGGGGSRGGGGSGRAGEGGYYGMQQPLRGGSFGAGGYNSVLRQWQAQQQGMRPRQQQAAAPQRPIPFMTPMQQVPGRMLSSGLQGYGTFRPGYNFISGPFR